MNALSNVSQQPLVERMPGRVPSVTLNPMDMLSYAVQRGDDLAVIDKLMTLQERWEASQGRKAFDKAIAAAKAEIPIIVKSAKGHTSQYADFASIAKVVDPIISKHGLHYRFRTVQTESKITVTCVLSHEEGRFEENVLCGPADTGPGRNAIQAIGSTLTYLQRYTLMQALGLAAGKDDDGRAAGSGETLSDDQIDSVRRKIVDVAADLPRFLKYHKVASIEQIPAKKFDEIMSSLDRKAAKESTNVA